MAGAWGDAPYEQGPAALDVWLPESAARALNKLAASRVGQWLDSIPPPKLPLSVITLGDYKYARITTAVAGAIAETAADAPSIPQSWYLQWKGVPGWVETASLGWNAVAKATKPGTAAHTAALGTLPKLAAISLMWANSTGMEVEVMGWGGFVEEVGNTVQDIGEEFGASSEDLATAEKMFGIAAELVEAAEYKGFANLKTGKEYKAGVELLAVAHAIVTSVEEGAPLIQALGMLPIAISHSAASIKLLGNVVKATQPTSDIHKKAAKLLGAAPVINVAAQQQFATLQAEQKALIAAVGLGGLVAVDPGALPDVDPEGQGDLYPGSQPPPAWVSPGGTPGGSVTTPGAAAPAQGSAMQKAALPLLGVAALAALAWFA
ncbi:hypothetical protein HN937_07030 [Candidatus Poribacteria bacterium]|jgi:hypothetical protein|nr:hypothetical protein [Candidatus Poribacteria bacterium]